MIQNELQNKSKYKNNNKCFSWISPQKKIQEAVEEDGWEQSL